MNDSSDQNSTPTPQDGPMNSSPVDKAVSTDATAAVSDNSGQSVSVNEAESAAPPVTSETPAPDSSEESPTPSKNETKTETDKAVSIEKEPPNIRADEGINLIPTMSREEIKVEERKTGFNYLGALSILILVLISIAIIGFNIITKLTLNSRQESLNSLEVDVRRQSDVIVANDSILERIQLYKDVQDSTFSPREVLVYWQDLTSDYGEVQDIELSGGLNFQVTGTTSTLTEVAQLWHLLSIDERVSTVNLDSVSGFGSDVRYSFEGRLNFDYFVAAASNGTN